ncbi:hypothetical protein X994_6330 (plasmid) [Burkholderia pseudomallei]|nr:hypothetical protein X994_6330 [Burkholderia pseudomallei]
MKFSSVLLLTLWSPLLAVVGPTLATFIHTVETVPATRLRKTTHTDVLALRANGLEARTTSIVGPAQPDPNPGYSDFGSEAFHRST